MAGVLCKSIFWDDILGSLHLFGKLQTRLTVKNSKNVGKVNVSKKVCDGQRQFFQNEGMILSLSCKTIHILLTY